MDKNGVVQFGKWNRGQTKHPLYGFGLLKNVEVFENRGIAKIKNRAVLREMADEPHNLPIAEVKDVYGNTYTLTGSTGQGTFYKNGTAIQTLLTNAWDMVIYKDYVWVRNINKLHAYGPISSGAAQWFDSLEVGFSQVYNGKLLVGQDDFLYTGNGNYVAKIEVTSSGTPAVAPGITVTLAALDLPDGQYVTTLCEFGKYIAIGTQGGSSYFDRGSFPNARVYTWNRQAGTLGNPGLADIPVNFSENGVNAMLQHANKLFVQAGTQGSVYITDGVSYSKIAEIPYAKSGVISNSTVYSNAMSVSAKGTLFVGLSGYGDTYSKAGVYEIDIHDPEYPISFRTISTGSVGTSSVLKIGFVSNIDYQTLNVGWGDGATYGVDTSDFNMYSNFSAVIETELVPVGTNLEKHTFSHVEWCLAEPLVEGQNIRISGRKNSKEDYVVIGAWGFEADTDIKEVGEVISFEDESGIADCEYVQLQIELDQDESTVYGSNVNLIGVRIW